MEGGKNLSVNQRKLLNDLEARTRKEGVDKLAKIERDYYNERTKIIRDGEGKVRDLKATNAATLERYAGQELKAKVIELKASRDAQMR